MSEELSVFQIDSEEFERTVENMTNGFEASGINYIIRNLSELLLTSRHTSTQLQTECSQLNLRVRALESTVRALTATPAQLPEDLFEENITINAAFAFEAASNFHKLEYSKAGSSYRWTGPNLLSTLTLYLEREAPITVDINIHNFSLKNDISIQPWVDGEKQEWQHVERHDMFTTHTVVLPPRSDKLPTLIGIETNKVWHPRDFNPTSKDDRFLGVAFHSLKASQ